MREIERSGERVQEEVVVQQVVEEEEESEGEAEAVVRRGPARGRGRPRGSGRGSEEFEGDWSREEEWRGASNGPVREPRRLASKMFPKTINLSYCTMNIQAH